MMPIGGCLIGCSKIKKGADELPSLYHLHIVAHKIS